MRLRTPVVLLAAALLFVAGSVVTNSFCDDAVYAQGRDARTRDAYPTPIASLCSLWPPVAPYLGVVMTLATLLGLALGYGGPPKGALRRALLRTITFLAVLLSSSVFVALIVALHFFQELDPNTIPY
jgi:hypothetical protein